MDKLRVDKWLWAARFFKTRALAAAAVTGGKVHVNGERVKAAKTVCPGDCLRITRGEEVIEVLVKALAERRGPATDAALLYEESASSLEERTKVSERRRLERAAAPRFTGRPDKKSRRQIRRFTGKK